MKTLIIVGTALLLTTGEIGAADTSGNDFLRQCTDETPLDLGCLAYITGFREMLDAVQMATGREKCLPESVETGQIGKSGNGVTIVGMSRHDQTS